MNFRFPLSYSWRILTSTNRKTSIYIGAPLYWDLLRVGKIQTQNGLTFFNTHLGWIATGKISGPNQTNVSSSLSLTSLNSELENFWELDDYTSNALKVDFVECIQDYSTKGHAKLFYFENNLFFLPHHAVIKQSRETTKCCVVFDASCHLDAGLSVDLAKCVGPVVQSDLFAILIRFRMQSFVFAADNANVSLNLDTP